LHSVRCADVPNSLCRLFDHCALPLRQMSYAKAPKYSQTGTKLP
jgi:hypothetical protein